MEVKRYIYQSPYNAPVQFGRPDPSSMQNQSDSYELSKNSNETLKKAEVVKLRLQNETAGSQQKIEGVSRNPGRLDIYV